MTVTIERAQGVGLLDRGRVAADAVGLAAIPDRWIPIGSWRCYATAPLEADHGRIVRTETEISLRFDHFLSPTAQITEISEGRIRVAVETFWPEGGFAMTGGLSRRGDTVTFEDEDSDLVAELRKGSDSKLTLRVQQAGKTQEMTLVF